MLYAVLCTREFGLKEKNVKKQRANVTPNVRWLYQTQLNALLKTNATDRPNFSHIQKILKKIQVEPDMVSVYKKPFSFEIY
jgi:hypothetical protein